MNLPVITFSVSLGLLDANLWMLDVDGLDREREAGEKFRTREIDRRMSF